MTRIANVAFLTVASLGLCRGDIASIRATLQSALAEQEEGRLQKPMDFVVSTGQEITHGPREDVRSLLPLAQECLRSRLATVREYGLAVFLGAALRIMDGSELIEPYVDSALAPLLDDHDLTVKGQAILILGHSNPDPLPKALDRLFGHLNDKNNTEREAGGIVGALLAGRPSDAKTVRAVLDFVSHHPDFKLRADTIRVLGHSKVTTEESLKFIREGLADQDQAVRKASVEAVGQMPPDTRTKFSPDLLRLLASPTETIEIRELAEKVVHQ